MDSSFILEAIPKGNGRKLGFPLEINWTVISQPKISLPTVSTTSMLLPPTIWEVAIRHPFLRSERRRLIHYLQLKEQLKSLILVMISTHLSLLLLHLSSS